MDSYEVLVNLAQGYKNPYEDHISYSVIMVKVSCSQAITTRRDTDGYLLRLDYFRTNLHEWGFI